MIQASDIIDFTVPATASGLRIDKCLAMHFVELSRTRLGEALDSGAVRMEGKPVAKSLRLKGGELLQIAWPAPKVTQLKPTPIDVEVLYEDEYLIAINKPSGQVVHPGSGTGEDTMVHALLHYSDGELSTAAGAARPGVVHRLDKETSGVILFAKTDEAYHALTKAFSQREMRKDYVAIVGGSPRLKSGRIDKPIGRHPQHRVKMAIVPLAREAITDWKIESSFSPRFTLLRAFPHTGRTHQIRVHLSSIGHPIMGDKLYGYRPKLGDTIDATRVMLHADKIEFEHPITGAPLSIRAPWPEDFKALCAELQKLQL